MNMIQKHIPGNPMPCPPDAKVFVQTRSGEWSTEPDKAGGYYWGDIIPPAYSIVAWRYAEQDLRAKIETSTPSKYHKTIRKTAVDVITGKSLVVDVEIDVYDVLVAFDVTNPAAQHAIKKLLMPGKRGAKDTLQDLREAAASITRAIEIEEGAL